jgi:hypothetical protein
MMHTITIAKKAYDIKSKTCKIPPIYSKLNIKVKLITYEKPNISGTFFVLNGSNLRRQNPGAIKERMNKKVKNIK